MAQQRKIQCNIIDRYPDLYRVPIVGVESYLASVTLDAATGAETGFDIQVITNKAAGNDTALLINQTDTVSGGTSLLLDCQTDAASVASIDNAGAIISTAIAVSGASTFASGIDGAAMTTGEGTGWAGVTTVSSEITKQGKIVTTHVFIDIAGLVVSTTVNDVIGDSAANNSHGGQFQLSESGQFISGSITCLEAPTAGDADIDFNVNSLSTLAESVDVGGSGTNVILLANTESWTLGMVKAMALLPNATSDYLYLSAGAGSDPDTYTAGQFLIELIGYKA